MERANRSAADMLETLEGGDWLAHLVAGLAARTGADADELAQRTRIAAWKRFGALGAPRSWLAKVARNAAREEARASRRRRDHEATVAVRADGAICADGSGGRTPDAAAEAIEARRMVLDAVEALPAELREVIALRHLDELSIEGIARHTASPAETVRSRLARGRGLLRRDLERRCHGRPWLAVWLLPPGTSSAVMPEAAVAAVSSQIPSLMVLMKAVQTIPVLLFVAAGLLVGALLLRSEDGLEGLEGQEGSGSAAVDQSVGGVRGDVRPAERVAVLGATALEARGPTDSAKFDAPGPAVSGLVTDLDGRVIRGARVFAMADEEGAGPEVLSDEDGRFVWNYTSGNHRLRAGLEGSSALLDGNVHSAVSRDVLLVLVPAIVVGGQTVDAEGEPLPGVRLSWDPPRDWSARLDTSLGGGTPRYQRTVSGEDGRFRFEAVAVVPGASLRGNAPNGLRGVFRVPDADRTDLVLTFKPRETVSYETMKVTLTSDGVTPRGSAMVHLPDWAAQAGEDGVLEVPLSIAEESGSFMVTDVGSLPWMVKAQGGGKTLRGEPVEAFAWLNRPSPWPVDPVVVLPDQEAPRIRGVVTDAQRRPVEGADIWISNLEGASAQRLGLERRMGGVETTTGADGGFEIVAIPGRAYTLNVCWRESLRSTQVNGVRAGEGILRVTLDTERLLCELRGRCLDPDGTPIQGVKVEPRYAVGIHGRQAPFMDRAATSNAAGEFVLTGVPVDVTRLQCDGLAVIPVEVQVPREAATRGASGLVRHIEVTVPRRAYVRFDTRGLEEGDYTASLFGGNGERAELLILTWIPSLEMEGANGTLRGTFVEGLSPIYAAQEGGYRAQLTDENQNVIAEMDVTLLPVEEPTPIVFR